MWTREQEGDKDSDSEIEQAACCGQACDVQVHAESLSAGCNSHI